MPLTEEDLQQRIFLLNTNKSLKEFAQELDLPEKTLKNWKYRSSLPQLSHLTHINQKTGAPIDWLLTGKSCDYIGLCMVYLREMIGGFTYNEFKKYPLENIVLALQSHTYNSTPEEANGYIDFVACLIGGIIEVNKPPLEIYCDIKKNDPDHIYHDVLEPDKIVYLRYVYDNFYLENPEQYTINAGIRYKTQKAADMIKERYLKDSQVSSPLLLERIQELEERDPALKPDPAPNGFWEIPLYSSEIPACQPHSIREKAEGIIMLNWEWCQFADHTIAIKLKSTGNSMEPTIPSSATVILCTMKSEPYLLKDKIVLINKKNGGAIIRRLVETNKGWCGIPDNRDPDNEIIILDEGDKIIGEITSIHYKPSQKI